MASNPQYAQNFYLASLNASIDASNNLTVATFPPSVNTVNFTDYSANAICRMKLSVAKNMFQFWAKSADISQNSLQDLVFRTMYDPSSGWAYLDSSANPMSLDFTLGTIVTYSDPSNICIYTDSSSGQVCQTLLPNDYLRYLAYLIFGSPNGTINFTNSPAVLSSVNNQSKLALNKTLKGLTAYTATDENSSTNFQNNNKIYNYNSYFVNTGNYYSTYGSADEVNSNKLKNPSSTIFQQIRTNVPSRIENINPQTEKIQSDTGGNANATNGAWYKMPLIAGDSIYFVLSINIPTGQKAKDGNTPLNNTIRKYRIRMFIEDDNVIANQTGDTVNNNNIVYGQFSTSSIVKVDYSYADYSNNSNDANDVAPPGSTTQGHQIN
jgi:hypothetical protein